MSHDHYRAALVAAAAATAGVFVASVLTGPTEVTPAAAVESVRAYDPANDAHLAVQDIRLPRAILTLLVGAALAAAGAVMQGVTRNPLAGPSIMGLSGGAALAALVALIAWPGLGYTGSIAASFAGAAAGYGCVLAVTALSPGGFAPTRIALAGAVVSALFSAVTQGLVIAFTLSHAMAYWTAGGVTNVTWEQVAAVLPCVAVGLAGVLYLAPDVTVLSLGEVAVGLGQRTGGVRVAATLLVLLLTGTAVAVAGPVAFVGLMTPHACRLAAGADYRRVLPLSIVGGAGLTAAADLAARTALGGRGELPLGVVTAVLGAPFFLWLLHARRDGGLDGGSPGQVQARPRRSPRVVFPVVIALLLVVSAAALVTGRAELSFAAVLRSLVGDGNPQEDLLVWTFRAPRLAFGLLVGFGVAVSGTLMQAVLRNDLAEPGILGVSSGAGLAVVLLLAFGGRAALGSVFWAPLASTLGALAATLAVYHLCGAGRLSPTRLLLTGVAVSSVLGAITLFVSLRLGSDAHAFMVAFGCGSLNAAGWNYVGMLAAALVVLVPLAWSFALVLNVLRLGETTATGLGVPVAGATVGLLALAVAIGAASMAFAGGVLFLGLIAPHVARRLVGADHAVVLPLAGLVGATQLVLADVLGRSLLPGVEVPAGVMVSALGAPYFLYLLARSK
jgi:ferric hydroxamate transport system permease protein